LNPDCVVFCLRRTTMQLLRTLATLFFALLLLNGIAATARAETYLSASIPFGSISSGQDFSPYGFGFQPVGGTGTVQLSTVSTETPPACLGVPGAVSSNSFTNNYSWLIFHELLIKLPLIKRSDGTWVPASATYLGTDDPYGQVEASSTLSASGIVTTSVTEYGSGYGGAFSASYSEGVFDWETVNFKNFATETWDLNTGAYTNTKVMHDDFENIIGYAPCSGGQAHFIETVVGNGVASVSFAPAAFTSTLAAVNPYGSYAAISLAPSAVTVNDVFHSPGATALAADGLSAVALVFQSTSTTPVTFSIAASGTNLPSNTPVGSLSNFDSNYLTNPTPPPENSQQSILVSAPSAYDPTTGVYTFLALLWGPGAMPVHNIFPLVTITTTASQQGATSNPQISVSLMPPPLLLVHGVWSSADGAWPLATGFPAWLAPQYPHNLIYRVDYGADSYKAFDYLPTQNLFASVLLDALASAATSGMAARRVDVFAHSMGGLVTRYFLSHPPASLVPGTLPGNPVHKFITVGTPHNGSQLATVLELNQNATLASAGGASQLDSIICAANLLSFANCTLGNVMATQGKAVYTGVQSLEPASPDLNALSTSNIFDAIEGDAPSGSGTEGILNALVGGFLPGQTIYSILGTTLHDTIVPYSSQVPSNATDSASIDGIVHTAIWLQDTGETASSAVWQQAYYWLTGGTGQVPASSPASTSLHALSRAMLNSASASTAPIFDLTGYTQVAGSNVTFAPASGSVLGIDSTTNITASSSTKTISEVLLLQTVVDPTDVPLQAATQSPFTLAFTPTRLGSATFVAIVLFSDNTYATTQLTYTLQPSGGVLGLNIVDAPVAPMAIGTSRVVHTAALFSASTADVTALATYAARSGGTSVFSVGAGGAIMPTGNGVDWLDVTYNGMSASAQISVGACSYQLMPGNQIIADTGGAATIQVVAPDGCAWTAATNTAWLTLNAATGSGSGVISLTAAPNSTTASQSGLVTVGNADAVMTQPATACSYELSANQISAPASGANGSIGVTTTCPVIVSSSAAWLSATVAGASVVYDIAPNQAGSRTATLLIGTQTVPITQGGMGNLLTITAGSPTMTYGGTVPTITSSYAGFVNGDSASSLSATPTCTTTATSSSPAGLYPSTCTGAVDANYTISYVQGTVTVSPAPLTITAGSGSYTYGGAVPAITPSYSGFVNGDTPISLSPAPLCSTTATGTSAVSGSPYTSSCTGAADDNYTINYANGSIAESPAPLTVTAPSPSMNEGASLPPITPTYTGFVNGDGAASLTTQPTCTTAATSSSIGGNYTVTCSGAVDTNYNISYVGGTLKVTGPGLSLSANSLSFAAQMAQTTSTAQTVTVTNTGNANLTFSAMNITGPFGISSSGTTCSASTPIAANTSCTVAVTFTPATGGSATGSITLGDNVAGAPQTVALSGTGEDFSFGPATGSSNSATVAPGQTASYTLSEGTEGGLSGMVNIAVTGAPSEATCTASPNPANLGSNVTISCSTTAPSAANAPDKRVPQPPASSGERILAIVALGLAVIACVVRRNRICPARRQSAMLSLVTAWLLALAMVACGGGGGGVSVPPNPGTPAGTYILTVTATVGSGASALSHSVTLTLKVS